MKKFFNKRIVLGMVLVFTFHLSPFTSVRAQMQAVFGYSTFYVPKTGMPYVETYLSFDAWTMEFQQQEDGKYRATAEVLTLLKQGDSVCFFKKYDLNSPSVSSLDELNFSFLDVQRFSMRNGIYDLEITLKDKGSDRPSATVVEKLVVNYDGKHPTMSNVQLMSSVKPTTKENILSRGGYDMEPYVSDFFPQQVEQLKYYYEVYDIDKEVGNNQFLAMAYIEQAETGTRFQAVQHVSRKNSSSMLPVYESMDIKALPSGNYNLVVELRNSKNQLMLYRKVPFFRSNPSVDGLDISDFANTFVGSLNDEDQLNTYLDALYPIASEREKTVSRDLIKRPGIEEKQAFLYRFWQERYPLNAEAEWLEYKKRIDYVQATFSYPKTQGIHTDRGRIYLKYGPPDFVRDEKNFVSAPARKVSSTFNSLEETPYGKTGNEESQGHVFYLPYQLWRYNKLPNDDPERVFLFWDEHRSGYYTLLNSNVRGEIQEAGWERRLCRNQLDENVIGEVGLQFERGY